MDSQTDMRKMSSLEKIVDRAERTHLEVEGHQTVVKFVEDHWGQAVVYDPDPPTHDRRESIKSTKSKYSLEQFTISFHEMEKSLSKIDKSIGSESESIVLTIPFLPAALICTVLEDTITEFRILVECNSELRLSKIMIEFEKLRKQKYGVQEPEVIDELAHIDPHKLDCNEYKLNKLDADRNFISNTLLDLYLSLMKEKQFEVLLNQVRFIKTRDKYMEFLSNDQIKNKATCRELIRQLRQLKNHVKTAIYDVDATIDSLKSKTEDSALLAETHGRYVDNWQNARTEQHFQTINDKENISTNSMIHYKRKFEEEQRVHHEVEFLTNQIINETYEKVLYWMDKFDTDMEQMDLKIQIAKHEHAIMRETRIGLERTFNKHDREMREWIAFKEKREKERQYTTTMTNSAIIVQAWWRGLLVRKQLGPFRPKKKRPAPKKPY